MDAETGIIKKIKKKFLHGKLSCGTRLHTGRCSDVTERSHYVNFVLWCMCDREHQLAPHTSPNEEGVWYVGKELKELERFFGDTGH